MQMNSGKLAMWPEIDVGSELPLTMFDVTHPSLAAVKADMLQLTSHPHIRKTETEQESDCLSL